MNEAPTTETIDRMTRHDALNHLHVLLGNLELLTELNPDDRLLDDARNAAAELNRLLRREWGR